MGQEHKSSHPQIARSLLDDRSLRCIECHDFLRQQQADCREKKRRYRGELHHKVHDGKGAFFLSRAPVLGGKHKPCRAEAHNQKEIDIVKLVGQG